MLRQKTLHSINSRYHVGIQSGNRGSRPPPLKNNKNIGFLRNTGLDPMKKIQS